MAFTAEQEAVLVKLIDERVLSDKIAEIEKKYEGLLKPVKDARIAAIENYRIESDTLNTQKEAEIAALTAVKGK